MRGEQRKRKNERSLFHSYAVAIFVKCQGIRCNEFMHEFVTFVTCKHTHKSQSVPKRAIPPGTLVWKCHGSRFHSNSIHYNKSDNKDFLLSKFVLVEQSSRVQTQNIWPFILLSTTQTVSARPLFSLCGQQTPTENLWSSWFFPVMIRHYLRRCCWRNKHRQECPRMSWSNIYNYLPLQVWQIHPDNNIWRSKYKAQVLNINTVDFYLKKDFRSIQVTQVRQVAF